MRLYGKRFLRNQRQTAIDRSKETRDGIIWSIDVPNRQVGVRIQGSNKEIKAWFPKNWFSPPTWCKLGNAVRIIHKGGIGDNYEVAGEGLVVPYPMTGDLWPTPPIEGNAVLSGLQVIPLPNLKSYYVMVKPGTVRLEGQDVTVDVITMEDGDNFKMSMGGWMDDVAAVLDCSPVVSPCFFPDWAWLIHSVQVNQDGEVSLVTGLEFQAYNGGAIYDIGADEWYQGFQYLPTPEVPWGSIEIGTVTRWENQTVIEAYAINFEMWVTAPEPMSRYGRIETRMSTEITDPVMQWTDSETEILVTVVDNVEQYAFFQWIELEVEIIQGNGQVRDDIYKLAWGSSCICHQLVDKEKGVHWPIYRIGYKRGQDPSDESPLIKITLHTNFQMVSYFAITLLDSAGDPM